MQRVQLNRIIKKSIIARTIKSYITKAYACGNNDYNRLGFDDNRSKQVFARIPFFLDTKKKELGSDFETDWNKESGKEKFAFDEIKEIKAGGANTFLLSARGKVYVVGLNEYGQCGVAANDDGNDCVKEFTEVIFDEQVLVERIITSAQSSHSIAIAKNGKGLFVCLFVFSSSGLFWKLIVLRFLFEIGFESVRSFVPRESDECAYIRSPLMSFSLLCSV